MNFIEEMQQQYNELNKATEKQIDVIMNHICLLNNPNVIQSKIDKDILTKDEAKVIIDNIVDELHGIMLENSVVDSCTWDYL